MEVLSSLQNPRIQFARKLARRNVRAKERAFLVEGPQNVEAALTAGVELIDLFVSEGATVPHAKATGVTEQVMAAITETQTPQGPVAIVAMPDADLDDVAQKDAVLVLDQVRDPGNAGTLMRSALAAGCGAVIFSAGSVDPFGPKTVRSSAGALFGLTVVSGPTTEDALGHLGSVGFTSIGAAADAPQEVFDVDLSRKVAIVVGNEAWGFSDGVESELDELVAIPMPGPVESLNVSVAGSLLLFEMVRQRRGSRK